MAQAAELALTVPSRDTPRIQEVHITIGHVLLSTWLILFCTRKNLLIKNRDPGAEKLFWRRPEGPEPGLPPAGPGNGDEED